MMQSMTRSMTRSMTVSRADLLTNKPVWYSWWENELWIGDSRWHQHQHVIARSRDLLWIIPEDEETHRLQVEVVTPDTPEHDALRMWTSDTDIIIIDGVYAAVAFGPNYYRLRGRIDDQGMAMIPGADNHWILWDGNSKVPWIGRWETIARSVLLESIHEL